MPTKHNSGDNILPKKKRQFIKSSVTIHDLTQVETVFDYRPDMSPGGPGFRSRSGFDVEAWFFFPSQMTGGVNDLTKGNFYDDLRPMMRFREVRYTFKDFMGCSKRGTESPYLRLKKLIELYGTDKNKARCEKQIVDLARVCGCSFSSWFVKRINRRCKNIRKSLERQEIPDVERLYTGAGELLQRARTLLKEWRGIVILAYESPLNDSIRRELLLVEEYCHYRFRDGLARLIFHVQEIRGEEQRDILLRKLRKWTRWQWLVSRQLGLKWIDSESSDRDQELFMSHLNFLKKHMWQVLYLNVKERAIVALRRQFGYMIAAGFAAFWAFIANFLIWRELQFGGFGSLDSIDGLIGMSGFLVILAFVVSYILKDRIKELGRTRLSRGIIGDLPDYSEKITSKNASGKSRGVGFLKEWVHRIKDPGEIPDGVRSVRELLPGEVVEAGQKVLYYRKRVDLDAGALKNQNIPVTSVRDITRFNIRRHLARLDNPLQRHLRLSRKGQVLPVWIPKLYYLDIIFRYSYRNAKGDADKVILSGNRLILNKEGLQRIEKV